MPEFADEPAVGKCACLARRLLFHVRYSHLFSSNDRGIPLTKIRLKEVVE
jgi:hypothetical protein